MNDAPNPRDSRRSHRAPARRRSRRRRPARLRSSRSSCDSSPSCTAPAWRGSSNWRDGDPRLVDRFGADELVASLLLVHGLHPVGVEDRVEAALQSVRPFLAHHDGDVELLGIDPDAGAVLLRLLGSCDGCPSSAVTLQMAVERAIVDAAPEIVRIDVEAAAPPSRRRPRRPSALIPQAASTCPTRQPVQARRRARSAPDVDERRPRRDPPHPGQRRQPRAGARRAPASCAASRSPTPTATWSISSTAACSAPAAAATSCSPPMAPVGAGSAPYPTATSRSPTSA